MSVKPKPVARLTMVVEFDEIPDDDAIERILDEARAVGAIAKAEFETLQLVKKILK